MGAKDVFEAHDQFDHISYHEQELLPFYDRWLKDRETGWEERPDVRVYVMGPGTWRESGTWPPEDVRYRDYYLSGQTSGSVASLNDGSLIGEPPPADGGSTSYDYPDPKWKLGVVGFGPNGPDPVGRVLTFTTAPLGEDLEVVGPVVLELYAASTATDTDFFVRLADQFPQSAEERSQGVQPRAVTVTKGWLRASHREKDDAWNSEHRPFYSHRSPQPIEPGEVYRFDIEVMPCAYRFEAGHRIRLEIVNGDSPLTDSIFTHQYLWYKVGTDTIQHSAAHPSCLRLPVGED